MNKKRIDITDEEHRALVDYHFGRFRRVGGSIERMNAPSLTSLNQAMSELTVEYERLLELGFGRDDNAR